MESGRIRDLVWPPLRVHGFSDFASAGIHIASEGDPILSEGAWRHTEDRIEVVRFQFLNARQAVRARLTTSSFLVQLGIFFRKLPRWYSDDAGALSRPNDSQCDFRRTLRKTPGIDGLERADIWYVRSDHPDTDAALEDAKSQILSHGLEWFSKYRQIDSIWELLLSEQDPGDGTWGYGRPASHKRRFLIGYFSLWRGNYQAAVEHLSSVADSKLFSQRAPAILRDIVFARSQLVLRSLYSGEGVV